MFTHLFALSVLLVFLGRPFCIQQINIVLYDADFKPITFVVPHYQFAIGLFVGCTVYGMTKCNNTRQCVISVSTKIITLVYVSTAAPFLSGFLFDMQRSRQKGRQRT